MKLRGKISPGLIVPGTDSELASFDAGNDLTNRLDIVKWEPSTPGEHSGVVRGPFPASLARKTNAGRVQNFSPAVFDDPRAAGPWTATEKVDGTPITHIRDNCVDPVVVRLVALEHDGDRYVEVSDNHQWPRHPNMRNPPIDDTCQSLHRYCENPVCRRTTRCHRVPKRTASYIAEELPTRCHLTTTSATSTF
ncbi:hypothetical protein [Gordonia humi]|uniref:Uncharacterized protein n=1 Tax=Gordonia humi TaxID=686429 RepID=A0A840EZF8_9ACTN|nr:hypothetical protein [Gordonia humi]MBB4135623.1 hypothetical protein [Gordonia humi]